MVDIQEILKKHGHGLKPDQYQVFKAWVIWYARWFVHRHERAPLILQGPAGCGKSYTAARAIKACKEIKVGRIGICAWTHEAVAVIEGFTSDYGIVAAADTVMGLLALRLSKERDHNGHNKVERSSKSAVYGQLSLCCVDECSMLEGDILEYFEPESIPTVYMFDPYQLPPIGKGDEKGISRTPQLSPVGELNGKHLALTNVVRYAGQVLELATAIRNIDEINGKLPPIKDFVTPEGNLQIAPQGTLGPKAIELFRDPDLKPRVLAWANATVDQWNRELRGKLHPEYIEPYVPGEMVIAKDQIIHWGTDDVIARSSESLEILSVDSDLVDIAFSSYTDTIEVIKLEVRSPRTVQWIETIHPDTYPAFLGLIKWHRYKIANAPKHERGRLWVEYFAFLERFNVVVKGGQIENLILLPRLQYAYAMTIHQAQGKTFTHVLTDQALWKTNVPTWYKMRLAYTALTRASIQVIYG